MATLYPLCELCLQPLGGDLVEKYYALCNFAREHPKGSAIFAAID